MRALKYLFLLSCLWFSTGCSNPASQKLYPVQKVTKSSYKEQFTQNLIESRPKVDILFVVDSSGSMGDHQKNLIANIDVFLSNISAKSRLDYRIGVLQSSDEGYEDADANLGQSVYRGPFQYVRDPIYGSYTVYGSSITGYVTEGGEKYVSSKEIDSKQGLDALTRLKARMIVGINGSASEKFFDIVSEAFRLESVETEPAFNRPDAMLAIIWVTDTEDQSTIFTNADSFIQDVLKYKKSDRQLAIYGSLIEEKDFSNCQGESAPPLRLMESIHKTNGSAFNLCSPDFGDELSKIANDIAKRAGGTIYLSNLPSLGTLRVFSGEEEIPKEFWAYDANDNSIAFNNKFELDKYPDPNLTVAYVDAKFDNETIVIGQ